MAVPCAVKVSWLVTQIHDRNSCSYASGCYASVWGRGIWLRNWEWDVI